MYNIDSTNTDVNPDRVCLNCKYWQKDILLNVSGHAAVCRLDNSHKNPNDSCSQFMPKSTFDSLQDPNRYHDRSHKLI